MFRWPQLFPSVPGPLLVSLLDMSAAAPPIQQSLNLSYSFEATYIITIYLLILYLSLLTNKTTFNKYYLY